MRILVTGGAGYIGTHTCVELLQAGYDIVVADDLSNSSMEAVSRVKQITGADFPFIQMNICDEEALNLIFDTYKDIGMVIHFAGLKAVGESVRIPGAYYSNNLNSTLTLCRVMQKYQVKKFIFSSSATVYRSDNQMPLTEESATGNCTNPYGWTKYMCEQMLTDIARAAGDWSVVLLRYFNPVGAHKSGMIGEDPVGLPNNLMPFIAQTAIGRRESLAVYGDDYATKDGTGVRDYIHVVDLAKGHVAAAAYCEGHTGTEIFNLGSGNGVSVLEMVQTFEQTNKVKVPYKITDRRPGDIAVCYADSAKAGKILNWKVQYSLEDMCRDTWNWQSQNPNGFGKAD